MAKAKGNNAGGGGVLRLLVVAAATLLFLGAGFSAWQGWLIASEGSAAETVLSAQASAAEAVTRAVATQREQVMQVLRDPQLIAVIDDHAAAAASIQARLSGASHVGVFAGNQDDVLHANYREFGYGKAAQLMAALSAGDIAPVQTANPDGTHRQVTMVAAVRDADRVRAWVWLELPFDGITQAFESVEPGSGRIELRQGPDGPDLMLLAAGSTGSASAGPPVRIRGSAFWIAANMPRAYIVLPHLWPFAMVLALLCLGAGVALLWVRPRRGSAPTKAELAEPTLAEAMRDLPPEDAPKTPPRRAIAAAAAAPSASADVAIDRDVFRAYDIRGVVGKGLSADFARLLGRAIGSSMREQGLHEIVIGRDGRLSGPELAGALAEGLRAAGVDVIDVGAVPTPVIYYAAFRFNTGCCVSVTGSHNPPDYNGFKIVVGGETLAEEAIVALHDRMVAKQFSDAGGGNLRQMDISDDYIDRITSDVQAERRLKVVVDCGNGIAGNLAPRVLEGIGCDVVPLYCEVDGTFPSHHPDPSDPKNLEDLKLVVEKYQADLGVAFDGDGDRLGVVTAQGEIIYPDRLLMLFAQDVLQRHPGATIVYDVKCTGHLRKVIQEAAGVPLMWRTGHSLMKAKMRETEAQLGGEMSGHFFFAERWYGFDDGIYAAARLLEILASDLEGRTASQVFATLPNSVSTPELKLPMAEGAHHRFVEAFREKADFGADARLTTIDGVRVDWSDGWGLVRASNTTPALVLRFDADNAVALERIQAVFRTELKKVDPKLALPF
ncbi:phosphomannomutase/phosphoglucomutase [Pinirhizobacter soli]|uniref:phosphomannomutase/phosphoglucomutase n=1 Tax=Pinirhizobacter soli TaxID=2786953 RepID=UPI00202AB15C|nr:phosphomannomutase/phosphoglucomutase [Pinirhizobacter soli]